MLEGSPADGDQRGGRPRAAAALLGELSLALLFGASVFAAGVFAACDSGPQDDRPQAIGATVTVASANIGPSAPLPATMQVDGGTTAPSVIELAFDQLLDPLCITRQTFVLTDLAGNDLTPSLSYDPVSRIVSLVPLQPLTPGQTYRLTITTPSGPSDPNGLRSIGGTTLDPSVPSSITFLASAGVQPAPAGEHIVDFCTILPVLQQNCGTPNCHTSADIPLGVGPAAGLAFDSPAAIQATIGRTAEGANVGPVAAPPSVPSCPMGTNCPPFGVDMPIVDPGPGGGAAGDPGNSWLLYKLLLGTPCPADDDAGGCDTSAMTVVPQTYLVPWGPLTPDAQGTLADLVQGSPMPYPPLAGLTLGQMEDISAWIEEGAPIVGACSPGGDGGADAGGD